MYQFIPIKDFTLSWRWLDSEYTVLPDDILENIRPLSVRSAKQVTDMASEICCENIPGLRIEADSVASEKLSQLPIDDSEEIFVSWSSEAVIITTWGIFREYWEDFCYPSSDDVAIWPTTGRWLLCYFHYELFVYSG